MTTTLNALNASTASSTTRSNNLNTAADMQDRFLKLLVAQMNNQDPMNPMDNAQMTAQMAQINTVSGIQQLNDTVKGLASQFTSLQMMQGTSLVGRQVLSEGNQLTIKDGVGQAAVRLSGPADQVTVQVISPTGQLLDTLNLGARTAGEQSITWDASRYTQAGNPTFKVSASKGNAVVNATPLSVGVVQGVSNDTQGLQLQLHGGRTLSYSAVSTVL